MKLAQKLSYCLTFGLQENERDRKPNTKGMGGRPSASKIS